MKICKILFVLTELFASQITHIYNRYLKIASIERLEARRIKRYYPLLILYDSLTETPHRNYASDSFGTLQKNHLFQTFHSQTGSLVTGEQVVIESLGGSVTQQPGRGEAHQYVKHVIE